MTIGLRNTRKSTAASAAFFAACCTLSLGQAHAGTMMMNRIQNSGFEVTEPIPVVPVPPGPQQEWFQGSLLSITSPPGMEVPWALVANTDPSFPTAPMELGNQSAVAFGNIELRQEFTAFATEGSDVIEGSFWVSHPDATGAIDVTVGITYQDDGNPGTDEFETMTFMTTGTDWHQFDFTDLIDDSRFVTAFSVYGNSSGRTLIDNVLIKVPEPASLVLLFGSLAALLISRRRR